jgi:sugar O-acyltransferase (sialic acid O-acetyltransferase NeuD family)
MKIIIYGASGHGKVVADIVSAMSDVELIGFVDDHEADKKRMVGSIPVLGGEGVLSGVLREGVEGAIVAIGRNDVRLQKANTLKAMGFRLHTAVHPSVVIAGDVKIGEGTVLMPGVVINASARIGAYVIVNTSATVDHDCILGDGCHLSPGVHLAGNVSVGMGSHIGIGACIIQNMEVGAWSTVGAGAVVIRNVPAGQTVVGNPARELKKHA